MNRKQLLVLAITGVLCLGFLLPLSGSGPLPNRGGPLDRSPREAWVTQQILMCLGSALLGGVASFLLRTRHPR